MIAGDGPAAPQNAPRNGDPRWSNYGQTILEIGPSPEIRVDLRHTVLPGTAGRLCGLGLGGTWGVVTACNPRGVELTGHVNGRRTRELHHLITELGAPWLSADGVSPDGAHREAGFALGLSLDRVTDLARRFEQSALFWFDREAFWLVPVLVGCERLRLPVFPLG